MYCGVETNRGTERKKKSELWDSQCYVLVFDYTNKIDQKDCINIPSGNDPKPKVYFCFYTYCTYNSLSACRTIFPNQACNVPFVHTHYHIKYTLKGYAFDCMHTLNVHIKTDVYYGLKCMSGFLQYYCFALIKGFAGGYVSFLTWCDLQVPNIWFFLKHSVTLLLRDV